MAVRGASCQASGGVFLVKHRAGRQQLEIDNSADQGTVMIIAGTLSVANSYSHVIVRYSIAYPKHAALWKKLSSLDRDECAKEGCICIAAA
jgi:hypothetical protein